jgi:acyl-CoA thioester hydrolase
MEVRWGDMDALGHVNNTVYFRFFEEARMRLVQEMDSIPKSEKTFVLAHTSCDFIRPMHYPAHAVVFQNLVRVGRSSIEIEAIIEKQGEPGAPCAKGRYIVVGVDVANQRPLPWSEAELAQLQLYLSR